MANSKVQRYLKATATQGAADAFVEVAISTDIVPASGFGLLVVAFEILIREFTWSTATSAQRMQWALSRDTKAAMPELSDNDVIVRDGFSNFISGTSSMKFESNHEYKSADGFVIVEPILYFQLDSTATAIAHVVDMRLHYEEVKLTEVEILRLLNNA